MGAECHYPGKFDSFTSDKEAVEKTQEDSQEARGADSNETPGTFLSISLLGLSVQPSWALAFLPSTHRAAHNHL